MKSQIDFLMSSAITSHGVGGSWSGTSVISTGWQNSTQHAECEVSKIDFTIPTNLNITKINRIIVQGSGLDWPYDAGGVEGHLSSSDLDPTNVMRHQPYPIAASETLEKATLARATPGGNYRFIFRCALDRPAGKTYYIYFNRTSMVNFGMDNVSVTIDYDTYTPVGPSKITESTQIYPGNKKVQVSANWTHGTAYYNCKEEITYFIEDIQQGNPKELTDCSSDILEIANPEKDRGKRIFAQIKTVGPYNTAISDKVQIGRINSLPQLVVTQQGQTATTNAPIYFLFNKTDTDRQTISVLRQIDSGSWVNLHNADSCTLTTNDAKAGSHTIRFVPNDGLEQGSPTTVYNFNVQTFNPNHYSWNYIKIANVSNSNLCYQSTLTVENQGNSSVDVKANVITGGSTYSLFQDEYQVSYRSNQIIITFNLKNNVHIKTGGISYKIEAILNVGGQANKFSSDSLVYPNLSSAGIRFDIFGEKQNSSLFDNQLTCKVEVSSQVQNQPYFGNIWLELLSGSSIVRQYNFNYSQFGAGTFTKTFDVDVNRNQTYTYRFKYSLVEGTTFYSSTGSIKRIKKLATDSTTFKINNQMNNGIINPLLFPDLTVAFQKPDVDSSLAAKLSFDFVLEVINKSGQHYTNVIVGIKPSLNGSTSTYTYSRENFRDEVISTLHEGSRIPVDSYKGKISIKVSDGYSTSMIGQSIVFDFNTAPTFSSGNFTLFKEASYSPSALVDGSAQLREITNESSNNDSVLTPGQSIVIKFQNVEDKNNTYEVKQSGERILVYNDLKSVHLYYYALPGAKDYKTKRLVLPSGVTYSKLATISYTDSNSLKIGKDYTWVRFKIPKQIGSTSLTNKIIFLKVGVEDREGNMAIVSGRVLDEKNFLRPQCGFVIGRREPSTFKLSIKAMSRVKNQLTVKFSLSNIDKGNSEQQLGYNNFTGGNNKIYCLISSSPSFSDSVSTSTSIKADNEVILRAKIEKNEYYLKFYLSYEYSPGLYEIGVPFVTSYLDATPTISHRFHQVAVNAKPEDLTQSSAVLSIRNYGDNKRKMYFLGKDNTGKIQNTISVDLLTGEIIGIEVDCGTW